MNPSSLRYVPTRTLNGEGGMTKEKAPIERWDTKEWSREAKTAIDRELARRARRRKRRQKVMHSAAGQAPVGSL